MIRFNLYISLLFYFWLAGSVFAQNAFWQDVKQIEAQINKIKPLLDKDGIIKPHNKIVDLKGEWKFSPGDSMEWAKPDYNDRDWDQIPVPGLWEHHGFDGYDGYAWYRKEINGRNFDAQQSKLISKQSIFLHLGYIDDVDEVYFNGVLIGRSGSFPPKFSTAYNASRIYRIPNGLIRMNGPNTISVRVYDKYYEGGIVKGEVGIYGLDNPGFDYKNLEGIWKFAMGDFQDLPKNPDSISWDHLMVPGLWENQGYPHRNGYAWYYLKFSVSREMRKESLILMLGLIDDLDEVYLNGEKIGYTGFTEDGMKPRQHNPWAWQQQRGYRIPENLLRSGYDNHVLVRVYDQGGGGGIHQGPVGIIKADDYTRVIRKRNRD